MDEITFPHTWLLISGILSLVFLFLYSGLMLAFRRGWNLLPPSASGGHPFSNISVIIPLRNEAAHLSGLINALAAQDYPTEFFEVLFINDHSTDETVKCFSSCLSPHSPPVRLISLPAGQYGKKAALEYGIGMAQGELIVQADGDIQPGKAWLSSISAAYKKNNPLLIILPLVFSGPSGFLQNFFKLEFTSLIASAAGSAGIGRPVLCNGANLAYPKHIFSSGEDVFNREVTSGDDMLLLEQMKKKDRKKILFLKSPDAIVSTPAPATIREFLQQRFRWVSKSNHYRDPEIIFTALLVFITNLWSLILLCGLLIHPLMILLWFIYGGIKSVFDAHLISPVLRFLSQALGKKHVFLYQWMYPFYILVSVCGGLSGSFRWKGRKSSFSSGCHK